MLEDITETNMKKLFLEKFCRIIIECMIQMSLLFLGVKLNTKMIYFEIKMLQKLIVIQKMMSEIDSSIFYNIFDLRYI